MRKPAKFRRFFAVDRGMHAFFTMTGQGHGAEVRRASVGLARRASMTKIRQVANLFDSLNHKAGTASDRVRLTQGLHALRQR